MADYRLLKDYPGVPAGEILVLGKGGNYRGSKYPEFWLSASVVESVPVRTPDTDIAVTLERIAATKAAVGAQATDEEFEAEYLKRLASVVFEKIE